MAESSAHQLSSRLNELGTEIETRLERLRVEGVAEGAHREAIADLQMQQKSLAEAAETGGRPVGELEHELNALRLSFEHWIARIDADYVKRT